MLITTLPLINAPDFKAFALKIGQLVSTNVKFKQTKEVFQIENKKFQTHLIVVKLDNSGL